jgi:kynurenine formamidase
MRIIDLSHPLVDGQLCFPGDPTPRIKPYDSIAEAGFNTTLLTIGSHAGTHLDAPFHYLRDGTTVDRIPLEVLYGPAVLVDLAPDSELGLEARISPAMLALHGDAFQPGARVLIRTGWDKRFGEHEFFRDYPSFTEEAAEWIAERRIALLGMDMPSPAEDGDDVHRILLGAGIILVEALANLASLPREFVFLGLPLKVKGRDGSPIRAAAVVE